MTRSVCETPAGVGGSTGCMLPACNITTCEPSACGRLPPETNAEGSEGTCQLEADTDCHDAEDINIGENHQAKIPKLRSRNCALPTEDFLPQQSRTQPSVGGDVPLGARGGLGLNMLQPRPREWTLPSAAGRWFGARPALLRRKVRLVNSKADSIQSKRMLAAGGSLVGESVSETGKAAWRVCL